MTPGMLEGSSEAGPTQAIRSSCDRIAALLQTSDPVQSRPMLVSRRTVTGHQPAGYGSGARYTGQPCSLLLPSVGMSADRDLSRGLVASGTTWLARRARHNIG